MTRERFETYELTREMTFKVTPSYEIMSKYEMKDMLRHTRI